PAYNRGESELERDAERVLAMQLEGGDGPAWDDIRSDCWGYAWRVLPEMLDDGRLWVRYRELGGIGDLGAVRLDLEKAEVADLVDDTSSRCLPVFRAQLLAGRWSATGGATLWTWFVNLCILRFPPAWRKAIRVRLAAPLDLTSAPARAAPEDPEAWCLASSS